MAERSKRIVMKDDEKIKNFNVETMKLLRKYEVDMSLRGLSERSINGYLNDINSWLTYVYDNQFNVCITELTEDDIEEFLYFCKQKGNKEERIKRRTSSISAFYKFLRKKKIIKENPMEFIARPKRGLPVVVQTFLTPEQVSLMREKLEEYGDLQLQTYALFSLSTMARVNAISNLKWEQVDFENRICTDVLEKEGKIVDLYFSDEVCDLLKRLKQKREDEKYEDYGYIFRSIINKENQPINNQTLCDWAKKVGKLIDVPTLHPHDFRHSGATLLRNQGMSLEDVSTLLNHSGTDVTKRFYIKIDTKKVAAMKDQFKI